MDIPSLSTARLRLDPLSFAHSDGVLELWSNPSVCQYSGQVRDVAGHEILTPVACRADSDKIIDFWERASVDGWGFRWAVLCKSSLRFLGTVGFNSLGTCSEIAFHLVPQYWGSGFMTEASVAAINCRREAGGSEFEAFIETGNAPSISLALRLGFQATNTFCEGAQRYVLMRGFRAPGAASDETKGVLFWQRPLPE